MDDPKYVEITADDTWRLTLSRNCTVCGTTYTYTVTGVRPAFSRNRDGYDVKREWKALASILNQCPCDATAMDDKGFLDALLSIKEMTEDVPDTEYAMREVLSAVRGTLLHALEEGDD